MELELGLGLPNQAQYSMGLDLNCVYSNNNGEEEEEEEEEVKSKGLSLLLWSGHEDDDEGEDTSSGKSRRLHDQRDGWMANRHGRPDHVTTIRRSSMYVKVKMEGMPIGRKIDIRTFNSYRALTETLIDMFGKCKSERRYEEYTILYQNKEGDWMLAGDSPWESFVECVQRMEIVRKND